MEGEKSHKAIILEELEVIKAIIEQQPELEEMKHKDRYALAMKLEGPIQNLASSICSI